MKFHALSATFGLLGLLAAPSTHAAANTALYWDANGAGGGTGGTGTWDTTTSLWRLGSVSGALQAYPTSDPIVTADLQGTAGTVTLANSAAIQVNNLNITASGYVVAGGVGSSLVLTSGTGGDPATVVPQITGPNSGSATVSAVITGSLGMQKGGSGTLVLSGSNTYTGNTAIRGGVLSVSSIGATGSASSNLGAGTSTILFSTAGTGPSTLLYTGGGETTDRTMSNMGGSTTNPSAIQNDGSGALILTGTFTSGVSGTRAFALQGSNGGTVSGNIINGTGTNSLIKAGTGTWALTGANNSYTGGTTVSAGTLLINSNNANATGAVAVNAGTLGGNGTIGGDVAVANSAILAPGTALSATETLTLNSRNLTFSGVDSKLNFDITGTSAGSFDRLVGINSLVQNGDVTFTLSGIYGTASWDVLDFSSKSGSFDSISLAGSYVGLLTRTADTWTGTIGGQSWTFEQTTGVLSVVPEPATGVLIVMGAAFLIFRRRPRVS